MLDVIIGTLAGTAIGSGCTWFYMLHWRDKYRVCRAERQGGEDLMVKAPARDAQGRFLKVAA